MRRDATRPDAVRKTDSKGDKAQLKSQTLRRDSTRARTLSSAMWIGGVAVLPLAIILSICVGVVQLHPNQALMAILSPHGAGNGDAQAIVWSLRLPRIVVAILVGAGLAAVGVVMQAVFRNPLADPGITGVSAGSAVGAVGALTLGLTTSTTWGVPAAAFIGGVAVAIVLLVIQRSMVQTTAYTLILVGVSINALASGVISILISNAKDDALVRSAMFWLTGDLDLRNWDHVGLAVVPIVAGIALLLGRGHTLNALSLGDDVAATSGINTQRSRMILLLICAVITGAAVSVSGIISFVGLIVPHAIRLLIGSSHGQLLPLSALYGASFLVIADTLARTAFSPAVVQTGAICALVGAPLFLFLLIRKRGA